MLSGNNRFILVVAVLFTLAACETEPSKQDMGTVLGGILGGVAGSQVGSGTGRTAAVVAGALVGAYIGRAIGKNMDDRDRLNAGGALETSPTGKSTTWRNPDTGVDYAITPTRTYKTASGPCRDFTSVAVIEGRKETVQGAACRQSDGTWKTM